MNTKTLLNSLAEKTKNSLSEIYNLKKDIEESENQNKQFAAKLHTANNDLQRNVLEINTLKKIKESLEEDLSLNKTIIEQHKNNLNILNKELLQLKKNFNELQTKNADIEIKNAELINENESAKNVIKENELEIQRLNGLFEQKKKVVSKRKL